MPSSTVNSTTLEGTTGAGDGPDGLPESAPVLPHADASPPRISPTPPTLPTLPTPPTPPRFARATHAHRPTGTALRRRRHVDRAPRAGVPRAERPTPRLRGCRRRPAPTSSARPPAHPIRAYIARDRPTAPARTSRLARA